jgi:hypothetical protein
LPDVFNQVKLVFWGCLYIKHFVNHNTYTRLGVYTSRHTHLLTTILNTIFWIT